MGNMEGGGTGLKEISVRMGGGEEEMSVLFSFSNYFILFYLYILVWILN